MKRKPLKSQELQPLLSHIDSEEASLRAMRRVLEEMPIQFVDSDAQRLMRQRVQMGLEVAEKLSQQRSTVLQNLGRRLGIGQELVTISNLIALSPAEVVPQLVAARSRLTRMVMQLHHLMSVVGWVVRESRDLNAMVVQEWMGQTTSDRYNASGRRAIETAAIRYETRS